MELDDFHPTDAEVWNYLVQHGDHDKPRATGKVKDAFIEVLKSKWEEESIARIDMHVFAVIWLDSTYKNLATRLANGPTAKVFSINTIHELKKCRLEGYWDNHLENAICWLEMVFSESPSRISQKDFYQILECCRHVGYEVNLSDLFWDGGETNKVGSRREEFLSHLPFTEYNDAYYNISKHPPDPKWDFKQIIKEINDHGEIASKVMLHVALWYDPNLKEPSSRTNNKPPIYKHLKKPFGEILSKRTHADASGHWKTKAFALQRIVIEFTKDNVLKRKRQFMATLKFNQPAEVYHERFGKKTFWDGLARRIHHKMPEIPFQHLDLLPYNSEGSNIYHSRQRPPLRITPPAHPREDGLPAVDYTAADEDLISPWVEDLIEQEYGSEISGLDELFLSERSSSTSSGSELSLASPPTTYLPPSVQDVGEEDADAEYYDSTTSIPPPARTTRARKRKNPHHCTPGGSRRSKILKLKVQHTTADGDTAAAPSASASDALQSTKNRRRNVNFFREQVERQNHGPSKSAPEPTPSTPANDGQKSPIDPICARRRRRMQTNLPDNIVDTPGPSIVESTPNIGEPVRSPSQPPPLTAPPAPMFTAVQEVATAETIEIPHAEPTLGEVGSTANMEEPDHLTSQSMPARTTEISQAKPPFGSDFKHAVQIILDEFFDKLNVEERIAVIKGHVDKLREQVIANQLNLEQNVAAIKENAETDKLGITAQVVAVELSIKKQVDVINEKAASDKSAIKGQVDVIHKEVNDTRNHSGAIEKQVNANKFSMQQQLTSIKDRVNDLKEEVNANKLDIQGQVAAMKDSVAATAPTAMPQVQSPSIDLATDIVGELIEGLDTKNGVKAFNMLRDEKIASLFLKVPAMFKKRWIYNEIGVDLDE